MTSVELKILLETIANSLDSVKNIMKPDMIEQIIAFLNNLDRTTIDLIIAFLKGNHPNLTRQEFVENVQKITEILTTIKTMITSGQVDELITKCRALENRPFLLTIISKFF